MHEKLNKGLQCGLIGNALFVLFAIVTFIYYETDGTSKILEILAYTCEFGGFGVMLFSSYFLIISLRDRKLLKIGYTLYTVMEAFLMYCELNTFDVVSFYKPYSLPLAIVHAIISAAVCFTFLTLDPYEAPLEFVIIVCVGLILGGMFGNIIGIRIYFSILVNAITFTAMFAMIIRLVKREQINIECHGDQARVMEYSSVFFEDEKKDKKKPQIEKSEEDKGNQ